MFSSTCKICSTAAHVTLEDVAIGWMAEGDCDSCQLDATVASFTFDLMVPRVIVTVAKFSLSEWPASGKDGRGHAV